MCVLRLILDYADCAIDYIINHMNSEALLYESDDEPVIAQTLIIGRIRNYFLAIEGPGAIRQPRRSEVIGALDSATGDLEYYQPVQGLHLDDFVVNAAADPETDPHYSALGNLRKSRTTRTHYDTADLWRARGGDPEFKLPKGIFHPGKLA